MRGVLGTLGVAMALALSVVPAAAAAQQVGNPCGANDVESSATILGGANGTSEPIIDPSIPPEHDFVITSWSVLVEPGLEPLTQRLVVAHVADEVGGYVKRAESAPETVNLGLNVFPTRIPVKEYDAIGLTGLEKTLICHRASNNAMRVKGPWAIGELRQTEPLFGIGAPVMVTVERDEDGDGYGDETQDGCPASALDQGRCQVFGLITPHRKETKRALWLELSATLPGTASVSGTISWPRAKPRHGQAVVKLLPVSVSLTPGTIIDVRLPLPRSVRRYLAKLPHNQAVQAELKVSATSERGDPAAATRRFKVKGRKRR